METVTLVPLAVDILAWRDAAGTPQRTVIVKATFELRHREPARHALPYPLFGDLHYEENEGRSLRVASDYVPRKVSVDVLVTGAVYAPPGERVTRRDVRFALLSGDRALVDKRIVALGPRERAEGGAPGPSTFAYLPLRYELAYGGSTSKSNPIGVGADPGDPRLPLLVHPDNAQLVAGLGPVPASWWWRKRALVGADPSALAAQEPTIPSSLDFAYFNAAPPDQQIPRLDGGETVVLVGLHPTMGELSLPLPAQQAHARIDSAKGRVDVPLRLDTLWIEADTLRCTLTWRGAVPAEAMDADTLASARLTSTLANRGEAPLWEARAVAPEKAAAQAQAQAPIHPLAKSFGGRTLAVELELERPVSVAAAPKAAERPKTPPRVTPHVPVVNATELVVWTTPWQVRPPEHTLTVIVKGTFTIGDDGAVKLSDAQDQPSGDVPHDDAEGASLRYASDFAIFKPAADVLLVGHAYPTDPKSGVALVDLRVGELHRRVGVFGDRSWGAESKSATFDRMPLRWERAMGGPLSDANPVGRGYKTGVLLPNLERPEALVVGSGDRPEPACFAPVAPMWKARRSKLGTYDASWLETRWPYLPMDFDWAHFNAAPAEQQVPYLRGDERFSISGVRPGGGTLAGRLPGRRPRVFAQRTDAAGGAFFEVLLRLDTAWFDADAGKVVLVWRGLFTVADEDAPDLAALYLDQDDGDAGPLSLERAQQRFFARATTGAVPTELLGFPDEPTPDQAPPLPAPPPAPTTEEVLARLAAGESLAAANLAGVRLAGADLTGVDFTDAVLARADLTRAKLDRAKLAGAVLAGATADEASFRGADLTGADMTGARLGRAVFAGADLSHALLDGVQAGSATFAEARGESASFAGAALQGATFDRAKLRALDLSRASLEGASFRDAELADVRLYDARGDGAVFEGATLDGARAQGGVLRRATLTGVRATGSAWESADLTGASLQSATLSGAIFTRARLDDAVLNQATATEASFRRASLRRTRCLKANLMQAIFERADLTEADRRGANLYQAETWRAKTDRADLSLANVKGTKLAR